MKQYQLIAQNFMGMEPGTILFGPLPILAQSGLGYYTKDALPSAPSTDCIFASAVENNPKVFKELPDVDDPTKITDA